MPDRRLRCAVDAGYNPHREGGAALLEFCMSDYPNPGEPIRFVPNRVWRCYKGGSLLDKFLGYPDPQDGNFPEEWLASTTRALNGGHSQGPDEGLSRVLGQGGEEGPLLTEAIASNPRAYLGDLAGRPGDIGVLCKYLDSAVRLPMQCHPDREFARQFYNSDNGKAESWFILGTREIGGEKPYLMLGFKPRISERRFAEAVDEQDIAAMEAMFNRVEVKPGEVYFIPGRMPHAIGPGVLMLEVQEPTDWVVQPEKFLSGVELSDRERWGPLDPQTALQCFDYTGEEPDSLLPKLLKAPDILEDSPGGVFERIIGSQTTDCFKVSRLGVFNEFKLTHDSPFYIAIVAAGGGELFSGKSSMEIGRGDVFMLPAGIQRTRWVAGEEDLSVFLVRPGRVQ